MKQATGWRIAYTLLFSGLIIYVIGLYATEFQRHYGYTLFVALPTVSAFLLIMIITTYKELSFLSSVGLSTIPVMAAGIFFLVTGVEGFICLAMAMIPMLILAMLGGLVAIAADCLVRRTERKKETRLLSTVIPTVLLLLGMQLEPHVIPIAPTRMVQTNVAITGSAEDVWKQVTAFPPITQEPRGLFATGIAYPLSARIEGTGVGAVRYCTFSTGDFVEPITVWEPPRHLAFDVSENPLPMREWSFYGAIDTPHLHGFMVSERGEFRIESIEGNRVLLTGTTWYHHELWPNFYWGWLSDQIIHQVHRRVLDHIKDVVESQR